jgi:SAM-dependent methyltransferase
VDFSPVAIGKGRQLAEARGVEVEWVVADLLRYAPPPRGFDLVLIAYLHLPPGELAAVFERAGEAVAPGGVLFAVGHDVTNIADGTGGPHDASLLYTPESVTGWLTGLRVDHAGRARRPVDTPAGVRDAIDTVVRAHRPAR